MQVSIIVDPVQVTAISQPFTGDGATAVWTDPKVIHTVNIPRDALDAVADAIVDRLRQARPPQIVLDDGSLATMPDGSILTLGANGEVYRDGEQLPGVAARQVVQFGVRIYAQGKTNPLWWRWTGSGWLQVSAFDPRVLADLPVVPPAPQDMPALRPDPRAPRTRRPRPHRAALRALDRHAARSLTRRLLLLAMPLRLRSRAIRARDDPATRQILTVPPMRRDRRTTQPQPLKGNP